MTTENPMLVEAAARAGIRLVVLPAADQPPLSALAALNPTRYPFLMESSAGAAAQSRFDLLLAFPADAVTDTDFDHPSGFFTALDCLVADDKPDCVPGLPFIGGWFVYLGYEMASGVEPGLVLPDSNDPLPGALAVRCPAAVLHDRALGLYYLLAESNTDNSSDDVSHDYTGDVTHIMRADLVACANQAQPSTPLSAHWHEDPPENYLHAVNRAREYILAGDVFQANLARAWHGQLSARASPSTLYATLRAANPAPFSGLLQWQDAALICSSPERLLSIDGDRVSVRPIAGTRQRSAGRDADMTQELITHPKERAEHVMLIDLVRNDLGRVCTPGTVNVDELMVIESYTHVHHIVSNVCGTLRAGTGPGSVLRAVFPGGTITGCPKVRCMQIIAELEGVGRGAYTGSFGYLSRCGQMDTNIVIRSLTQQGCQLTLRTGAGIVADSDPESELAETRHKARGVLRAFVDNTGAPYG